MWRRVEVRNFRSIEDITVDLAPFTVVVGPNGSGKSNFADVPVFARDILTDASAAIQNRGGIASVRRWRPSRPNDVTLDMRTADTRRLLDTDYFQHSFTLASKPDSRWEFKRELFARYRLGKPVLKVIRDGKKFDFSSSVIEPPPQNFLEGISPNVSIFFLLRGLWAPSVTGLRNARRFRLNPEAMKQPQLSTERTRLDESGSNIAIAVRHLRKNPKSWEPVKLAMRKIIPGLLDIEDDALGRYVSVRFVQRQAGGTAQFAATEMSEGAIRALGILVAAQQMEKSELLIIEEPEVSIHPGAATLLFDVLKVASRKGAVLLTTHSAELLDAARDEEILVCDYREGVTALGPLANEQRKLVKDGLLSVAELMRSEPLRIEGAHPVVIAQDEA